MAPPDYDVWKSVGLLYTRRVHRRVCSLCTIYCLRAVVSRTGGERNSLRAMYIMQMLRIVGTGPVEEPRRAKLAAKGTFLRNIHMNMIPAEYMNMSR